MESPSVSAPTFEHHHRGFGLGHSSPRISWRFQFTPNTIPGWIQNAYDVEITWLATGKQELYASKGNESILVPWPAHDLKSRELLK